VYISHMRVSTMENAQGHHQDSLAACTCVCVCACARVSGNREKLPKSSDSSLLNICVPTIAYTAVAIIRTPNAFTTGLNDRTCQQCVYESLRMQRGCVCVCVISALNPCAQSRDQQRQASLPNEYHGGADDAQCIQTLENTDYSECSENAQHLDPWQAVRRIVKGNGVERQVERCKASPTLAPACAQASTSLGV